MDTYGSRIHFGSEHKEFVKDVTNVIISYTPISGVIDTIRFGKKWLHKKKMHQRVATYIKDKDRRSFLKARSRRIRDSYRRIGVI